MNQPAPSFDYHGDLAETALPEILYTIDRFRVPGVIEVERDDVVKRVHIKDGTVLHATSSDLEDSLGSHILRTGKISREQYEATMRERRNSDKKYGVLLIEAGVLSPSEVYKAIRQHSEEIVWSLFYLGSGRVTFSIGDHLAPDVMRIQLPMRQVILQGIKRAPNAKELVARLGRRETVFEPAWRTEELIEIALDGREARLLSLVDGRRTLYEVCTEGPFTAAENAKVMYAFQVLRLIRQEGDAVTEASVAEAPETEPASEEKRGALKIRFKTTSGRGGD